jgi:hypothetical protein
MNRERNITIVNIILLLMIIGLGILQYIKTNSKPKYLHTIVISFCDERESVVLKLQSNANEALTFEDIESYSPTKVKNYNICNLETIEINENE